MRSCSPAPSLCLAPNAQGGRARRREHNAEPLADIDEPAQQLAELFLFLLETRCILFTYVQDIEDGLLRQELKSPYTFLLIGVKGKLTQRQILLERGFALFEESEFPVEFVIASTASHEELLGFAQKLAEEATKSGQFAFPPMLDTKIDQAKAALKFCVDKLEERGDLSSRRVDVGGRSRVVYRVTPQGTKQRAASVAQWSEVVAAVGRILQGGKHEHARSA
jgi:hypothetical protein